jgi:hypothetical protein
MAAPLEHIGRGDMSLGALTKRLEQFSNVDRTSLAGQEKTKPTVRISGSVRIENNEMLAINGELTGDLEHNGMPTQLVGSTSQSIA